MPGYGLSRLQEHEKVQFGGGSGGEGREGSRNSVGSQRTQKCMVSVRVGRNRPKGADLTSKVGILVCRAKSSTRSGGTARLQASNLIHTETETPEPAETDRSPRSRPTTTLGILSDEPASRSTIQSGKSRKLSKSATANVRRTENATRSQHERFATAIPLFFSLPPNLTVEDNNCSRRLLEKSQGKRTVLLNR